MGDSIETVPTVDKNVRHLVNTGSVYILLTNDKTLRSVMSNLDTNVHNQTIVQQVETVGEYHRLQLAFEITRKLTNEQIARLLRRLQNKSELSSDPNDEIGISLNLNEFARDGERYKML